MTNKLEALTTGNELLIANGHQTADLLRHLADNEIDSDYFAVVSECESYGREVDAELSITEFAILAAGYVDALIAALEQSNKQNEDLQTKIEATESVALALRDDSRSKDKRIAELEASKLAVKLPSLKQTESGERYVWSDGVYNFKQDVIVLLRANGITVQGDE